MVTQDGQALNSVDILAHFDSEGLSRHDSPEFLLTLPELPLTASGKILKRELARAVKEGRVHPIPMRRE